MWYDTQDDSSSLAIQKSSTIDLVTPGPLNSNDGINHDMDVIWLWLNPRGDIVPESPNSALWGYTTNPQYPLNEMDVQFVYVAWLKDPSTMPQGVKNVLARSWAIPPDDGSGAGLTPSDYATILARDPFWNGSTAIDTTRFDPQFGETFPYEPAPVGGQPVTQKRGVGYQVTSTQGQTATDSFQLGFSRSVGPIADWFNTNFTAGTTMTWTNKTMQQTTAGSGQSATVSITGPTSGYRGSTNIQVYKDNVYGTFMFAYTP